MRNALRTATLVFAGAAAAALDGTANLWLPAALGVAALTAAAAAERR